MRWNRAGTAMLLVAFGAAPLAAQQTTPPTQNPDQQGVPASAEMILGLRQRLNLTQDQVNQLETLRKQQLAQRETLLRERMDLMSQFRAGDLNRDTLRQRLMARRDAQRQTIQKDRDRIGQILQPQQRDQLMQLRRQAMRGRGMARGGRGFGPPAMGRRGFNGGVAPGFRGGFGWMWRGGRSGGFGGGMFFRGMQPRMGAWGRGPGAGGAGMPPAFRRGNQPGAPAMPPAFRRGRVPPGMTPPMPPAGRRGNRGAAPPDTIKSGN